MTITDDVVLLRPFSLEDADVHLKGEDAEQIKWLSGGKSDVESVISWIRKNQAYWKKGGPIFNFAIVEVGSDTLIGMVEASTEYEHVEGIEEGDANISYGLYHHARGKGYASRAVKLMLGFLKGKGLKRAVVRINPENTESLKVPLSVGFQKNGVVKTKNGEALEIFVKKI